MKGYQSPQGNGGNSAKGAFLGIHYANCGVYGRIYKTKKEMHM